MIMARSDSEGTILDDHMIKKLVNLNYTKVRVIEKDKNFVSSEISESFNVSYNASVNCFKSILYDAAVGKNINMEKVDKVVMSVVARLDEKRDIVRCINQIKSADQYTYTHCVNVFFFACCWESGWVTAKTAL